jgi:nitronate monooxygenase
MMTLFTEAFGVRHPIALAPMGGTAGGALAAAVSRGGDLGMLGAGDGDPRWLDREVLRERAVDPAAVADLLARRLAGTP